MDWKNVDPAFAQWLEQAVGGWPIKPDDQDYDANANPATDAEYAVEYRRAQARKLLRLYGTWKANQN